MLFLSYFFFFFFNDTATTEIYTLSLHDALPICTMRSPSTIAIRETSRPSTFSSRTIRSAAAPDRKSTRLNSSHTVISYAVFCLKKKKKKNKNNQKKNQKNETHNYTSTRCHHYHT